MTKAGFELRSDVSVCASNRGVVIMAWKGHFGGQGSRGLQEERLTGGDGSGVFGSQRARFKGGFGIMELDKGPKCHTGGLRSFILNWE